MSDTNLVTRTKTNDNPTERLLKGSTSNNNSIGRSGGGDVGQSIGGADNRSSYASNVTTGFSGTGYQTNCQATNGKNLEEVKEDHSLRSHGRGKSIDLETHGDEAITLCQGSTNLALFTDTSRLIFSSLLLILSIFAIVYAITEHRTLMPDNYPDWSLYVMLAAGLFLIGVLEGLQIAVVELAHENPYQFERYYPRAAKLLKYENKGRNVERFLIGRQVSLVFLVFVCARITTFDIFIVEAPNWIIQAFMNSGFLGVILIVTVAQLTPQVLAAAYPIEFLNLPGMNIAFMACIIIESTGLAHAVWLLCFGVKKTFYSCLCKYHELNKMDVRQKKREEQLEKFGYKDIDTMASMAKDIEMSVDEESMSKRRKLKEKQNNKKKDKDFTINNSKVAVQIEQLMSQIDDRPDLFYLLGDDKYPGPSFYSNKFKQAGVETPCFLLPVSDKNHIPPHIVAMALLKKSASRS